MHTHTHITHARTHTHTHTHTHIRTPEVPTRMRVKLDVSLTGGSLYTLNTLDFIFFDLSLRTPLMGTSKGRTLIQVKGLNLKYITTKSLEYYDNFNIRRIAKGVMQNTVCEFGSPPGSQNYFGMVTLGSRADTPPWPQFSTASCKQERVGTIMDEVCTISCVSPVIPNVPCVTGSIAPCKFFVEDTLGCPFGSTSQDATTYCIQSVPKYTKVGLSINFEGQRVMLPGSVCVCFGVYVCCVYII